MVRWGEMRKELFEKYAVSHVGAPWRHIKQGILLAMSAGLGPFAEFQGCCADLGFKCCGPETAEEAAARRPSSPASPEKKEKTENDDEKDHPMSPDHVHPTQKKLKPKSQSTAPWLAESVLFDSAPLCYQSIAAASSDASPAPNREHTGEPLATGELLSH